MSNKLLKKDTDHHDGPGINAWHPAQENAVSTLGHLQVFGTLLGSHTVDGPYISFPIDGNHAVAIYTEFRR